MRHRQGGALCAVMGAALALALGAIAPAPAATPAAQPAPGASLPAQLDDFDAYVEGVRRQFDVPGIKCEAVKNLLINDAPVCEGEGLEKGRCMDGIVTRSKATAGLEG